MPVLPKRSPLLRLDKTLKDVAKIRDNLSAIVIHENNLWLGGDEGTLIHRMTRDATGNFGSHKHFDLAPLLDLPVQGDKPPEIDIEGLDTDGGYLWLTGSHCLKREKPKAKSSAADNIKRLRQVGADGNRFTLGRVSLVKSGPDFELGDTGARLEGDEHSNALTEVLAKDLHLGPFVPRTRKGKATGIPSKDNGLDVEGLAVTGNRVFLGLRGPVLRGWTVILELEVKVSNSGQLKLAKIGGSNERYRKHFLELEGLGVRELSIRGKDLCILAGPTMNLDGPVFVFRWPKALDRKTGSFVSRGDLRKVLEVPFGTGKDRGCDHAEGISFEGPEAGASDLMVCYDSPAKSRLNGDAGVRADVFELASTDIDPKTNQG